MTVTPLGGFMPLWGHGARKRSHHERSEDDPEGKPA